MSDIIDQIISGIRSALDGVVNWLRERLEGMLGPIRGLIDNIMGGIRDAVVSASYSVANFFSSIASWLTYTVANPISNLFNMLWDNLIGLAGAIERGFRTLWSNLQDAVGVMIQTFKGWLDQLRGWAWDLWNKAVDGLNAAIRQLKDGINTVAREIEGAFDTVKGWIIDGLNKIKDGVIGAFDAVADRLRTGFEKVGRSIEIALNAVSDGIRGALGDMWARIKDGFDAVSAGISKAFDVAGQALNRIYEVLAHFSESAKSALDAFGAVIKDAVAKIIEGIQIAVSALSMLANVMIEIFMMSPADMACMMMDLTSELTKLFKEAGPKGIELGCKRWQELKDKILAEYGAFIKARLGKAEA